MFLVPRQLLEISDARVNRLSNEVKELEAQLAEANTFRENAMHVITSDCGVDHSQISFPDFRAQGGNQCSLCLTAKLAAAEAREAELRAALERIENAGIEKGAESLPYIVAEAQDALQATPDASGADGADTEKPNDRQKDRDRPDRNIRQSGLRVPDI